MTPKQNLPARLREAVLNGDGETAPALRRAVSARVAGARDGVGSLPEPVAAYVDKVARHAWRVTDEDVAGLRSAGYSDDEVFELTIVAAQAAGLSRLERGLSALRGEI